ncbi:RrF2 family transcriptional regulator [Fibrivirga algicola]|uniref:Rrf2 family transcriptional regulator n=1 Tax=Fibrivirga algicola TaxID=2950420 RepID=A0ABX0QH06_9BACT|nr:Rrf2 family transcriptional regulator [Fibrivirga algicola]ARK10193.1 Rrf2 family transcriptional regulator [Fibrella sp. ES10-3-2-2]NID11352.1 Rrf2 family transcriptional regulator [Fibrivirga algicola]
MISKKAKYAIKALKALTEAYGEGPVLIAQIAAKESIPQKFLESILLELRNHGVLQSQKGKGGGYLLRVDPERITLAQIIRIIDGPIAPTPCVSLNFYVRCDDCEDEETCTIRPIMLQVRDANLAVYETTTMQMLVDRDKPMR